MATNRRWAVPRGTRSALLRGGSQDRPCRLPSAWSMPSPLSDSGTSSAAVPPSRVHSSQTMSIRVYWPSSFPEKPFLLRLRVTRVIHGRHLGDRRGEGSNVRDVRLGCARGSGDRWGRRGRLPRVHGVGVRGARGGAPAADRVGRVQRSAGQTWLGRVVRRCVVRRGGRRGAGRAGTAVVRRGGM